MTDKSEESRFVGVDRNYLSSLYTGNPMRIQISEICNSITIFRRDFVAIAFQSYKKLCGGREVNLC